jgi:hypothetical protein
MVASFPPWSTHTVVPLSVTREITHTIMDIVINLTDTMDIRESTRHKNIRTKPAEYEKMGSARHYNVLRYEDRKCDVSTKIKIKFGVSKKSFLH